MYCQKCGTNNEENAFKCVQCGETLQHEGPQAAPPAKIPNYLSQSILVTLCCCLPLGIPAIVFAAQVNGKIAAGDIQGAMESSRKAKLFSIWGAVIGLIVSVIYAIINVAAGLSK